MTKIEKWIEERFPLPDESDGIPKKREAWDWAYLERLAAKETAKYILEECGVLEALEHYGSDEHIYYVVKAGKDGTSSAIISDGPDMAKEALNKIKGEKSE